jgi:hypothetical protein
MFGLQQTIWLTMVSPTIFFKGVNSHMLAGGSKFQKTVKTKFKQNKDRETVKFEKKRHHDKSYYRLAKQEKEEYGIS